MNKITNTKEVNKMKHLSNLEYFTNEEKQVISSTLEDEISFFKHTGTISFVLSVTCMFSAISAYIFL